MGGSDGEYRPVPAPSTELVVSLDPGGGRSGRSEGSLMGFGGSGRLAGRSRPTKDFTPPSHPQSTVQPLRMGEGRRWDG